MIIPAILACSLQAAGAPPIAPGLVKRLERHRAERSTQELLALCQEIQKTHPQAPLLLLNLGEIHASEGGLRNRKKAARYLERFLTLPVEALAILADARKLRRQLRIYLWHVQNGKKLWVASTREVIKQELARTKSARDAMGNKAEEARLALPDLRYHRTLWWRSRRPAKDKAIDRLTREIRVQERHLADAAALDAHMKVLKGYLAGKHVPLVLPPGTMLGDASIETRIHQGLEWLQDHQQKGGSWPAPPGKSSHTVGVTGLAVLALLAGGSSMSDGRRRESVRRGVKWLQGRQHRGSGYIGSGKSSSVGGEAYSHMIATRALIEAWRLSRDPSLDRTVRKALDYIQKARNPYKVWRYGPADGGNDSSVTGWAVLALTAAKRAGLPVDETAFKFARVWYEEVTDPNTGQCGYSSLGEPSARLRDLMEEFPHEYSEAMTAEALFVRFRLGEEPLKSRLHGRIVDTILKKPPDWDEFKGAIDLYYWFYGTQALYLVGGRAWKHWRSKLAAALSRGQLWVGSWKTAGAWCGEGGPAYATALAILCLLTAEEQNRLLTRR